MATWEGNLGNLDEFDGQGSGMMGDKEVAPGLKAMGFDIMNRANNHVFDSDRDGMPADDGAARCRAYHSRGHWAHPAGSQGTGLLRQSEGRVGLVFAIHTPNQAGNPSGATYRYGAKHWRQS